jgi:alpha-glucosidase
VGTTTEWWRGAALYQIYPLSFADSNGDGWGDLPGITSRLEHVASLGVDGIWLCPFYRSAWVDFGYDTTDQRQVDPRCGTLEDFDALVRRAHALGLKVLVDQVYTYTSDRHPWFQASRADPAGRYGAWYEWAEPKPDGSPPNNWLSIFGGPAWAWDLRRRRYYMTHFLPEMPHLRVQDPDVQAALLEIGQFWLDRGVDGFRLDVINLAMVDPARRDNPPSGEREPLLPAHAQLGIHDASQPQNLDFVRRIRRLADRREGRFLLGEIAGRVPMATAREYTAGDQHLHSAYFLLGADQKLLTADGLRTELQGWDARHSGWPTWSFGNHDCMRALTRCGGPDAPRALADLLLAVLATARGTLLIYQGEELGLPDAQLALEEVRDPATRRFYPDFLQRDGARTPMPWTRDGTGAGFSSGTPWLPIPAAHRQFAAEVQAGDPESSLAWTRRLLRLRRDEVALRLGDVVFHAETGAVLAFERSYGKRRIVCAFNLSDRTADGPDVGGASTLLARNVAQTPGPRPVLGPYGVWIGAREP